jgi:hypothetical protein
VPGKACSLLKQSDPVFPPAPVTATRNDAAVPTRSREKNRDIAENFIERWV